MQARLGLLLCFALIVAIFGVAAVDFLMEAAAHVFEIVPHN